MKDITYKTKRKYKDVVLGIQNRGFTLHSYGDCYNRSTLDSNGRVKTQQYATIKLMCNGWEWNIYNQNNELLEHDCSTDHLDDDCEKTYGEINPVNIGFTFTDWYKWENFTVIKE